MANNADPDETPSRQDLHRLQKKIDLVCIAESVNLFLYLVQASRCPECALIAEHILPMIPRERLKYDYGE